MRKGGGFYEVYTEELLTTHFRGEVCHVSYTHRKHHKEDHHGTDQRTGRGIRAS